MNVVPLTKGVGGGNEIIIIENFKNDLFTTDNSPLTIHQFGRGNEIITSN